jgi:hypothetical protein
MQSLKVGQVVRVDLSGLRPGSLPREEEPIRATIVALDPGVITVRLMFGHEPSEVTVSPGRVCD